MLYYDIEPVPQAVVTHTQSLRRWNLLKFTLLLTEDFSKDKSRRMFTGLHTETRHEFHRVVMLTRDVYEFQL